MANVVSMMCPPLLPIELYGKNSMRLMDPGAKLFVKVKVYFKVHLKIIPFILLYYTFCWITNQQTTQAKRNVSCLEDAICARHSQ